MSYLLMIRPEAEDDIEQAFTWYEEQAPGLGARFLSRVHATASAVADRPLSFPIVVGRTRRANLRRFPFSLFFIFDEEHIVVTAVLHQRREPDSVGLTKQ